jgi:hypothetical protein
VQLYLFIFAKMCLRNIALKKKTTNLLADKLITIMGFVQFCDIKNLANFSQKLAKIDEFTLLKIPISHNFFVGKTTKFVN